MSISAYETEASLFSPTEWTSSEAVMKQVYICQEKSLVVIDWELDDGIIHNGLTTTSDEGSMIASTPAMVTSRKSVSLSYPSIWLRDFCHCELCFDERSVTKKTNLLDLNIDTSITELSIDDGSVVIRWNDNHQSVYPAHWLWCNRFHDTAPDPLIDVPQELWSADSIRDRLREFEYDDVMTSDEVLCDWMNEIKVLGINLIKNAPRNKEALNRLGERVGYLKDTNFGKVSSVYAPTDPKNPIYTAGNLFFHTDLSYYQQQPGIELLHCIKQFEGVGGDSTLVDGFSVARQLRDLDPQAFQALSSQDVEFYQTGLMGPGRYFQLARNKIISLDANGEPTQISYSNHSRTSILRMPPEKVTQFYKAMKLFTKLLYDQKNLYTYKMVAGDIIVINNVRVLHGRRGFEMKKGSERHLSTAYLDWDLVYSRLRVLHKQLRK